MDVEIEWGFQAGTEKNDFDGRLDAYVSIIGPVSPLADDRGTMATGELAWQSRAAGNARRGIAVPLLYAPNSRPGLDSRITIWTKTTGLTFRISDLDNGPILIPEQRRFHRRRPAAEKRPGNLPANWRPRTSRAFAK